MLYVLAETSDKSNYWGEKTKGLNNLQKTRNNKGKILTIDLYMYSFVDP